LLSVSFYNIPALTKKMLQAGAKGYVTKNSPVEKLKLAITEVYAGRKYICSEIKNLLTGEHMGEDDTVWRLKK
jgi:DNA-binding NarL/FixJ family response regulator